MILLCYPLGDRLLLEQGRVISATCLQIPETLPSIDFTEVRVSKSISHFLDRRS